MNKLQPWEELSREVAFQKYGKIVEKVMFRLPDGIETDFYVRKERPAVAVLALTPDHQVITVKQFRPGPQKTLYELPGGYSDKDESTKAAMERELLEETGYQGTLQLVTDCLDDAYSTMVRGCFVATDCRKVAEPKTEATEFVEVALLPLDEFKRTVRSGQMTDVEVAMLGLDFLKLL